MNWNIKSHLTKQAKPDRHQEIISLLLDHRGLTTKTAVNDFLHPPHPSHLKLSQVGLKSAAINSAIKRINQAIKKKQSIVIYGDYDADGITATALLWLTLHSLGARVHPFIPHRQQHGYGLSQVGIQEIVKKHQPQLIITVDNGIVAHAAAKFVADQNIDLVITDHHQPLNTMPQALAIIHSDQISGSAVAWFLASKLLSQAKASTLKPDSLLDLVCIGTIADLMPMVGLNRSFAKHGLDVLSSTDRVGLVSLMHLANIDQSAKLSTYHVGFIIAPRINAMGRIDHGIDALRLLCTKSADKANQLAALLNQTNQQRQNLTLELIDLADQIYSQQDQNHKIIIIDHPDFHEGVIGLIAGKLTEKYHKPSIVISRGEETSKASARSITGVDIIKLIRNADQHLIDAGGHPGAAGLSLQTAKIQVFKDHLTQLAADQIDENLLQRSLNINCQVELNDLDLDLYDQINQFEPFGIKNPRPIFSTTAQIADLRLVGQENQHLKLKLKDSNDSNLQDKNSNNSHNKNNQTSDSKNSSYNNSHVIDAIGFWLAKKGQSLTSGATVNLAFTLDKNTWNNQTSAQLIIKDLQPIT